MAADSVTSSSLELEKYRALLEVSKAIGSHHDLSELFHALSQPLHRLVRFEFMALILYDAECKSTRLHILAASRPTSAKTGMEFQDEDTPAGLVVETQKPLVVADVESETRFPTILDLLREHGVKSFCLLPLTTAQRRVGALGFGCMQSGAYTEADVEFMQQVASQVAVAVDNALNYERTAAYQRQLASERDRLQFLLEVNNALVSNLELRELFSAISACLERVLRHDYTSLALYEASSQKLRLQALEFPGGKGIIHEEMLLPVEGTPAGKAFTTREPVLLNRADLGQLHPEVLRVADAEGLESVCCVPLIRGDRVLGTLNVASRRDHAFTVDDLDLLNHVGNQVAIAIENALAYRQIAELKNKLAEEKLYLEDEIRTQYNFEEIIGESAALKRILNQVETVAPTGSTVLIQGETGTGKELIARAIHSLSDRHERTFVKINCAAIPTGLLESELFGHEKGAFTGAISQKIGRFELAHGGTLFLDEVGDIPLEIQPKLLRVLQEQEFERLGATRTIRVDVRIVAATNRDLSKMVEERQFRSDLYYRLNVFPIVVPPLRERPEDIPILVRYFAQRLARRMNKHIETIPSDAMRALTLYPWPGNIRELENFIERAVILSKGSKLEIPLSELKNSEEAFSAETMTLEEAERRHILQALNETKWVIGGPRGAAARLGMKRTTLHSRMQKLGITRPSA
ncbi:MAG TPA: sigma 54-interacting transcriptional regulator [Terriglobia bacterium]|jgi:formate hydrogenlyase transcriptional activator|nr:sigma 54-interacting transcriptional regulator [Terriglobia bacterium]